MNRSEIDEVTSRIQLEIKSLISTITEEIFWIHHYGANYIHPKHLVYWICVETDKEKARLANDSHLNHNLRSLLTEYKYPPSGRDDVHIGFESQETVDRVSDGNWWQYWK